MKVNGLLIHKSEEKEGKLDGIEIRSQGGVIWLLFYVQFSRCVGSEKNLTRRVHTPAVAMVGLEYIGVVEVNHAVMVP